MAFFFVGGDQKTVKTAVLKGEDPLNVPKQNKVPLQMCLNKLLSSEIISGLRAKSLRKIRRSVIHPCEARQSRTQSWRGSHQFLVPFFRFWRGGSRFLLVFLEVFARRPRIRSYDSIALRQ